MKKIGEVALTQSQRNKRHYDKHREYELARNKVYYPAYYEKNREEIKAKRRNARHAITTEWHDAKMAEQDNKCAVCRKTFVVTPHIDHDHSCCPSVKSCSDCARGLLCKDCNLGLGRFKDSIIVLSNAIQYLKEYSNGNRQ